MRRNTRPGLAAWPLALACAMGVAGCADVVAPTTRTAIDSSLKTLAQQPNRQLIADILRSDEFNSATRSLTRAALDEMLSGGGPGADARLAKASADFARDIGPALGTTLDDVVLPRVQAAIAASVRTSLDQFLADVNRRRVGAFTAGVASQTVAGVAPQLEASISHGITSAVERILQNDLSPAIGKALDENTPSLARTTRAVTAAALAGVNDAMAGPFGDMLRKERQASIAQVQAAEAQQQQALVKAFEEQVVESRRWFEMIAAVAGVALVVMAVLLWSLLASHRKLLARL